MLSTMKAMGSANTVANMIAGQESMKTTTAIISLKTVDRFPAGHCVPASLLAAIALLLSGPSAAFAGSATWDLNPGSGDWNTATNWTPTTMPNSSADTATFAFSN